MGEVILEISDIMQDYNKTVKEKQWAIMAMKAHNEWFDTIGFDTM